MGKPSDAKVFPIIAISGFAGSGKNTVGEKVASALGWKIVAPTFKDLAEGEGITLMEFQERAKKDLSIDYKFDRALAEKAAGGKCVVVTWIGPWISEISGKKWGGVEIPKVAENVFRVWLDVPESIRISRLANRDGMDEAEAAEHIAKRDDENIKRYKKAYGIDIQNHGSFDLVLHVAADENPALLAGKIVAAARKKGIVD